MWPRFTHLNLALILHRSGATMPGFSLACTIEADLTNMRGGMNQLSTSAGGTYWALDFEVGILFGTTELAAIVIWKEKNVSIPLSRSLRPILIFWS
jgi:hypothetical protein